MPDYHTTAMFLLLELCCRFAVPIPTIIITTTSITRLNIRSLGSVVCCRLLASPTRKWIWRSVITLLAIVLTYGSLAPRAMLAMDQALPVLAMDQALLVWILR